MGYDPLGLGGNIHGIRKKKFYHGIRPFRVGGNFHGIRKKKLYDIYIYIEQDIDREREGKR